MGDVRSAIMLRQLAEKSEWAVNALQEVLLSIPHCTPHKPVGLTVGKEGCFLCFDDGKRFPVPVPAFVRPFICKVSTILVVTFRRTNIVNEIDVFVTRGGASSGVDAHA